MPVSALEYATHRPSGEKTGPSGKVDFTELNVSIFLVDKSRVHIVNSAAGVFEAWRRRTLAVGCQLSGINATPVMGFVSRSIGPVPSARCQNTATSPSRSDWNAMRVLSGDQTGMRLLPPYVNRIKGLA